MMKLDQANLNSVHAQNSFKRIESNTDFNKVYSLIQDNEQIMMRAPSPKSVLEFAQSLSKCVNLRCLKYNFNKEHMEEEGIQALGKALQNLTKLESLVLFLKWNKIQPKSQINELATSIESSKKTLKEINLDLGDNLLGQQFPQSLMKSILKCENLESLTIGLKSNNQDSRFQSSLQNLGELKKLKHVSFDFSFNSLFSHDVSNIGKYLSQISSLQSLHLDLKKNYLKVINLKILSMDISKMIHLQVLDLNLQENDIGTEGVQAISNSISNLSQLVKLSMQLGWTQIDDQGCASLLSNLIKCQLLKELTLDLKWNKIEQMESVDFVYQENQQSKLESLTLFLRNNNLRSSGLSKIIKFVSHLQSLRQLTLNIEKNNLNSDLDKLGQNFAQYLQVPCISFNLQENDIDNKGLFDLFSHYSQNKQTKRLQLDLRDNSFDYYSFEDFGKQLANFNNLNYLFLDIENPKYNLDYIQIRNLLKQVFKSKSIHLFHYKFIYTYDRYGPKYIDCIRQCKKAHRLVSYNFQ